MTTIVIFSYSRKMAWQDTTALLRFNGFNLTHRYLVNAARGRKTGSNNSNIEFHAVVLYTLCDLHAANSIKL